MGAILPWALSRSVWHAWGTQMPAALAHASPPWRTGPRPGAAGDSLTFDPWLLTSGGPVNGRMPTRGDTSQIAYGADSRVQSLLATADATGRVRPPRRRRRGLVLRRQPGGRGMYDPATGRTFDGIFSAGSVNPTPAPSPRSTACSR